jgi:hypothetical protein
MDNGQDQVFVYHPETDFALLTIIEARIHDCTDSTVENGNRTLKADTVLELVRRVLRVVPLEVDGDC